MEEDEDPNIFDRLCLPIVPRVRQRQCGLVRASLTNDEE